MFVPDALSTHNEIPAFMSLNRCLITTNLLSPLGQLMLNVHISCNNCVIIKHSLMLYTSQGQQLAFISISWWTHCKWRSPRRHFLSSHPYGLRCASHRALVVEKELLWQFVSACSTGPLNMAAATASNSSRCRSCVSHVEGRSDAGRSPGVVWVVAAISGYKL